MHPGQVHENSRQDRARVCRDLQWERILHPLQVLVYHHRGLHRLHIRTDFAGSIPDSLYFSWVYVCCRKVSYGIFIQETANVRQLDH